MKLDPEERLVGCTNKFAWTAKIEEDSGEFFFTISRDVLDYLGWDVGDEITWRKLPGGSWEISKKN